MDLEQTTKQKIAGEVRVSLSFSKEFREALAARRKGKSVLQLLAKEDVSALLHGLFLYALTLRASDIHMEPLEQMTKVRFRIDGLLHDVEELPRASADALVSRIKLISGIKLNVSDKPQDGRFSFFDEKGNAIEVRAATLPTQYGESLVLRLLNPKSLIGVDQLGLRKDLLGMLLEEIRKPNGMIVVTGPTGSGKTSTLYACLQEVQRPELKILTIEDPIEYHLKGISQSQVDESRGYSFASGLRAIVRQDPDVILVGEIRDRDTADIALQAALTGHLVFSTLHTNDAPGTVFRFTALGSQISTVAAALILIIAQRLVRRVCPRCATERVPTQEEKKKIQAALNGLRKDLKPQIPRPLKLVRPKGCMECDESGYRGRIGIFETILVDDEMQEFILQSLSGSALRNFAVKKGMVPMFQDGMLKVLKGITTLEELERVIAEE